MPSTAPPISQSPSEFRPYAARLHCTVHAAGSQAPSSSRWSLWTDQTNGDADARDATVAHGTDARCTRSSPLPYAHGGTPWSCLSTVPLGTGPARGWCAALSVRCPAGRDREREPAIPCRCGRGFTCHGARQLRYRARPVAGTGSRRPELNAAVPVPLCCCMPRESKGKRRAGGRLISACPIARPAKTSYPSRGEHAVQSGGSSVTRES